MATSDELVDEAYVTLQKLKAMCYDVDLNLTESYDDLVPTLRLSKLVKKAVRRHSRRLWKF